MNTTSPLGAPDVRRPQNDGRASHGQLSLPGGLPPINEETQYAPPSNPRQEDNRNASNGTYNPEAPFPELGPVGSMLGWALGYISPHTPTETASLATKVSANDNRKQGKRDGLKKGKLPASQSQSSPLSQLGAANPQFPGNTPQPSYFSNIAPQQPGSFDPPMTQVQQQLQSFHFDGSPGPRNPAAAQNAAQTGFFDPNRSTQSQSNPSTSAPLGPMAGVNQNNPLQSGSSSLGSLQQSQKLSGNTNAPLQPVLGGAQRAASGPGLSYDPSVTRNNPAIPQSQPQLQPFDTGSSGNMPNPIGVPQPTFSAIGPQMNAQPQRLTNQPQPQTNPSLQSGAGQTNASNNINIPQSSQQHPNPSINGVASVPPPILIPPMPNVPQVDRLGLLSPVSPTLGASTGQRASAALESTSLQQQLLSQYEASTQSNIAQPVSPAAQTVNAGNTGQGQQSQSAMRGPHAGSQPAVAIGGTLPNQAGIPRTLGPNLSAPQPNSSHNLQPSAQPGSRPSQAEPQQAPHFTNPAVHAILNSAMGRNLNPAQPNAVPGPQIQSVSNNASAAPSLLSGSVSQANPQSGIGQHPNLAQIGSALHQQSPSGGLDPLRVDPLAHFSGPSIDQASSMGNFPSSNVQNQQPRLNARSSVVATQPPIPSVGTGQANVGSAMGPFNQLGVSQSQQPQIPLATLQTDTGPTGATLNQANPVSAMGLGMNFAHRSDGQGPQVQGVAMGNLALGQTPSQAGLTGPTANQANPASLMGGMNFAHRSGGQGPQAQGVGTGNLAVGQTPAQAGLTGPTANQANPASLMGGMNFAHRSGGQGPQAQGVGTGNLALGQTPAQAGLTGPTAYQANPASLMNGMNLAHRSGGQGPQVQGVATGNLAVGQTPVQADLAGLIANQVNAASVTVPGMNFPLGYNGLGPQALGAGMENLVAAQPPAQAGPQNPNSSQGHADLLFQAMINQQLQSLQLNGLNIPAYPPPPNIAITNTPSYPDTVYGATFMEIGQTLNEWSLCFEGPAYKQLSRRHMTHISGFLETFKPLEGGLVDDIKWNRNSIEEIFMFPSLRRMVAEHFIALSLHVYIFSPFFCGVDVRFCDILDNITRQLFHRPQLVNVDLEWRQAACRLLCAQSVRGKATMQAMSRLKPVLQALYPHEIEFPWAELMEIIQRLEDVLRLLKVERNLYDPFFPTKGSPKTSFEMCRGNQIGSIYLCLFPGLTKIVWKEQWQGWGQTLLVPAIVGLESAVTNV